MFSVPLFYVLGSNVLIFFVVMFYVLVLCFFPKNLCSSVLCSRLKVFFFFVNDVLFDEKK